MQNSSDDTCSMQQQMQQPGRQCRGADVEETSLEFLLNLCSENQHNKDFIGCQMYAELALTEQPNCFPARRYLCWSLFELRRYEDCVAQCQNGIAMLAAESQNNNNRPQNKKKQDRLRRWQRACRILHHLQRREQTELMDTDTYTVTERLKRGWYATRLKELVESGNIQPFPASQELYYEILQQGLGAQEGRNNCYPNEGAGIMDCCILAVRLTHQRYGYGWNPHPSLSLGSVQTYADAGGENDLFGNRLFGLPEFLEAREWGRPIFSSAPQDVIFGLPFLDQAMGGNVYMRDYISSFHCRDIRDANDYFNSLNSDWGMIENDISVPCYEDGKGPCNFCWQSAFPVPSHPFPVWSPTHPHIDNVPPNIFSVPEGKPPMDVYYAIGLVPQEVQTILKHKLGGLARVPNSKSFSQPKIQNIIDPNNNVNEDDDGWIPTEFEISECRAPLIEYIVVIELLCHNATTQLLPSVIVEKVASYIGKLPVRAECEMLSGIPSLQHPSSHHHAALYAAIEQVVESAIPLLSKLRRPSMLLPGPFQAVVQAQRICFSKTGQEYSTEWDDVGEWGRPNENVVAVVLYFYQSSPHLMGGDIEIVSKISKHERIPNRELLSANHTRRFVDNVPRFSVPVDEGTMVVFSNYESVHRIRPLVCRGDPPQPTNIVSRDFLAFFVIDQRAPLSIPKTSPPGLCRQSNQHPWGHGQFALRESFDDNIVAFGWLHHANQDYENMPARSDRELGNGCDCNDENCICI